MNSFFKEKLIPNLEQLSKNAEQLGAFISYYEKQRIGTEMFLRNRGLQEIKNLLRANHRATRRLKSEITTLKRKQERG